MLAAVVLAPAPLFTALVATATGWGLYEVALMSARGRLSLIVMLLVAGGLPTAWALAVGAPRWMVPAAVIAAMVGLTAWVAVEGARASAGALLNSLLGALYVGVLFPYFALLRNRQGGVKLTIVILLLVAASDSGAYFVGNRYGRTKLLPKVSPGKTVAGAVGSLLSSLLAMAVMRRALAIGDGLGQAMALAAAVNVMAQAGDLAESALKRLAGVKDSGWIFPGHGGLLDRADSLLFAAVFTYYCF